MSALTSRRRRKGQSTGSDPSRARPTPLPGPDPDLGRAPEVGVIEHGRSRGATGPAVLDRKTASAATLTEALIRADRLGDDEFERVARRVLGDADLGLGVLRMLSRGANILGWELD